MDTPQGLAARLQHDARTPLNAILGMVELLEGSPLDEQQREYVKILRRSTESLISVVEGLPEVAATAVSPAPARLNGLRILLVDDADDNRFLIVRYLKNSGAFIDEACDGAEAVQKVRAGGYDVILMDVEMPVMDGFSASRAIRNWEREGKHQATRIIALTAHDPSEVLEESRAAGCDELVTKPVRKATLIEALAQRSEVEDLVPAYLAKRRADVPKLREALACADFATIQNLAHKLSGTGGGYGLPGLSAIGSKMERAAKASVGASVSALIDSLEEALRE